MNNYLKSTIGLSLGHFSIEIYAALLLPLYPLITSKLGVNLATISSIIAIGHLVASIMQPYFGFIADKMTHRIFMVWGLVASAVFIPFATKTTSVYFFLICLLLGMLGNAFFHPQSSSLMREFNKDNPKISRMMGIFLGLGTTGYALSPYVSVFFVEKFGYDNLIYTSLVGIVCAIFMYFFVPKIPKREAFNYGRFLDILKKIFKNKICIVLITISTVKSIVSICFGTYAPFLFQKYGFSLNETGLIITFFFLSGSLATILSSKVEKIIGAKNTIALSMFLILPFAIVFVLNLSKMLTILSFLVVGFLIFLSVGIILVQAQKAMPQYTGVISGFIQGVGWGIGSMFLIPFGFVAQYFSLDVVLITTGVVAFIAGVLCLKSRSLKGIN